MTAGIFLAIFSVVWSYTVFAYGGVVRWDRNVSLLALGSAALAYRVSARRISAPPLSGALGWAALLAPLYAGFQVLPLPVDLVEALSPARAEAVRAFEGVGEIVRFAPLSVFPEGTMRHFLLISGYALVFWIIRDLTWQYLDRSWIVAAPLIGAGFIEGALGLAQSASGSEVSGTLVNRNHYANLLAMTLPFAVMHAVSIWRRPGRRAGFAAAPAVRICVSLGLATVILLGIVYSYSRMGFVSALFALLAAGLMARTGAGRGSAVSLALIATGLIAAFVILPPERLIERFSQISSSDGITGQGRIELWAESLSALRDYPVFGCGLGGFESIFMRYKVSDAMAGDAYVHNDYLQLLIELGVMGFAIGALLMFQIARKAMWAATREHDGSRRCLGAACLGAFAAIGLHSFVDFNLYTPANAMLFAWISGIAAGLDVSGGRKT